MSQSRRSFRNPFDIETLGADGRQGGDGEDADIINR